MRRSCSKSIKLQRAWDKYGEDSFQFILLEQCDKNTTIEREQFWIDFFQSAYDGYNTSLVATKTPMLGRTHSEETKELLRAANIGKKHPNRPAMSDEAKANLSKLRKGCKMSDEAKRNISKGLMGNKYSLGRKLTDEHKAKISQRLIGNQYAKGFVHSEETRMKVSIAGKGLKRSEETKQRLREINLGKKMSPESIAKNVASRKAGRELKFKSLCQQMTNIIGNIAYA